ncbi:MAG: sodium:solute symporter family protein [Phycisphaeraceae bacterium]
MSAEAWTWVFITITFMVYLYIGWRSRVGESSGFYVAGRGVPAVANGAATAADWMSAASFISMAGMISFLGSDGSIYLMGWTGGYVLLALLLAPYLRKFGKYTVPDFVGERYYSETARVVAAICAIFVSLTYVAGQMRGVGIVFSRYLEVEIWQGVVVGMVIVAFFAVLGGMKGITWTQVVQYFIIITAFLVTAGAISSDQTGWAVPQLGMTFSDMASRLDGLHEDLGLHLYTEPFTSHSMLNIICITGALMVGTAGLPHVIVRFYTTKNVRAARYSAFWALLFIALLYTSAPALAMFARANLLESLHGAEVQSVETVDAGDGDTRNIYSLARVDEAGVVDPIKWVTSWQQTGLIKFDDADGDGRISMMSQDGVFAEAVIDRDIIVLSTPEVARLAGPIIALIAVGGLAAALSTAAGLLLVISSSMAHDLYIHFVDPNASEKRRVMVGRIMIIAAIFVAGYFGINPPGFVAQVVAFAFGLAAASFFPIILLGIFDGRTNREGAIAGMVVGLVFTATYIVLERFWHVDFESMLGVAYISSEGIGFVGCGLNFAVTLIVSRCTPAPPAYIRELVESVRVPLASRPPEAHFDEDDSEADNP